MVSILFWTCQVTVQIKTNTNSIWNWRQKLSARIISGGNHPICQKWLPLTLALGGVWEKQSLLMCVCFKLKKKSHKILMRTLSLLSFFFSTKLVVCIPKQSKLCSVKQHAPAGFGEGWGGRGTRRVGLTSSRSKGGLCLIQYMYTKYENFLVQIKLYRTRAKFTDKQTHRRTDGQKDWQTCGRTDKFQI